MLTIPLSNHAKTVDTERRSEADHVPDGEDNEASGVREMKKGEREPSFAIPPLFARSS